jgi:hypothetical protein
MNPSLPSSVTASSIDGHPSAGDVDPSVLLASPSGEPSVSAEDWVPSRLHEAVQTLRGFESAQWSWLFKEVPELETRIEALVTSLSDAATEWRDLEAQRVREAPIDEDLLDSLLARLVNEWREVDLVRKLFLGTNQVVPLSDGAREWVTPRKVTNDIPRSYFIQGSSGSSNEYLARELALALARLELRLLISLASESGPSLREPPPALSARLEAALSETGEPPGLAILMPVNPLIELELGLRNLGGTTQSESPLFGRPGVGQWYRGEFMGTPVLQYRDVPRDRILVLGSAWATYKEYPTYEPIPFEFAVEDAQPTSDRGRIEPSLVITVQRWIDIKVVSPSQAVSVKIDDLNLRFG